MKIDLRRTHIRGSLYFLVFSIVFVVMNIRRIQMFIDPPIGSTNMDGVHWASPLTLENIISLQVNGMLNSVVLIVSGMGIFEFCIHKIMNVSRTLFNVFLVLFFLGICMSLFWNRI